MSISEAMWKSFTDSLQFWRDLVAVVPFPSQCLYKTDNTRAAKMTWPIPKTSKILFELMWRNLTWVILKWHSFVLKPWYMFYRVVYRHTTEYEESMVKFQRGIWPIAVLTGYQAIPFAVSIILVALPPSLEHIYFLPFTPIMWSLKLVGSVVVEE